MNLSSQASRLSAQKNRRSLDGYLQATTLYVTMRARLHTCAFALITYYLHVNRDTCDISLNKQKEEGKGYVKFPRTLALKIIKRHRKMHTAVAIRMHLTWKEANRILLFYC